jgi:predicted transcriptional regulator
MKLYCEVVVGDVLPALRALITKELIENFGFTQAEAAKRLGLTQPAVSQYKKYLRGSNIKQLQKNKSIMTIVKKFSKSIASENISAREVSPKILEIAHAIVSKKIIEGETSKENIPCDLCFR